MTSNQGHSQPEATLQGDIQGNNDLALILPSLISPVEDLCWPNQPELEGTQPYLCTAYSSAFRQGAGEGWRVDVEGQLAQAHSVYAKKCLRVSVRMFTSLCLQSTISFHSPWFRCDPV